MPKMKESLKGQINRDLTSVAPSNIRTFDAQVSSIDGIVKLTLGEPDFNVPTAMKEAAIQAIEANDSHYTPSAGTDSLRHAIAHFLADRYQLNYDPQKEIAVTVGATEAIFASLEAILNPGDKVLIPTPTFPLYETVVQMLGAQPVLIDTSATDFVLTPELLSTTLEKEGPVKALVLNYPSNPTGVTYDADQLKALAAVIDRTSLFVIADEIYSELIYSGTHTSLATYLPEQTLVINGASKSHAMTGYRIGFIAGPAELMKVVTMVHSLLVTSPSNPAMAAAVAAFGTEAGRQATLTMKKAYQERRDFMLTALSAAGFEIASPNGAFYLFAKLPEQFNNKDEAFATALAKEGAVAVIPGSYFGPGGAGYLRLSYATSMKNLRLAAERIQSFVATHDHL